MSVVTNYTALLSNSTWSGGSSGQSVTLTYSFSTSATPFLQTTNVAAAQTFSPLTEAEKADVRRALGEWAAVSGISFHEVKATQGELTFGAYRLTSLGAAANVAGLGNYPTSGTYRDAFTMPHIWPGYSSVGGDVYLDTSYQTNPGLFYDFLHIAVHEIGHALGLKHPFDTPGDTLAAPLDNGDQTVMSYTGDRNGTLGPLDIAAIRSMYGTTPGAGPVGQAWNAATESVTLVGSTGADALVGTGGNDLIYSIGGQDAVVGGEGDDTIYASGVPIEVNGGPGNDLAVTGLAYSPSVRVSGTASSTTVTCPGGVQTYEDVETLAFTNGTYNTTTGLFTAAVIGSRDGTTGTSAAINPAAPAAGSPNYLQWAYVYAGSDDIALSTQMPNVFLHAGAGTDAIQVSSGQNVLDGGLGSNFLTGGSGLDTFFTDSRAPGTVWNTIRNFHAGDAATLWGFTPGVSTYRWDTATSGAAGSEGATLRANIVGGNGRTGDGIDASITFSGLSLNQAQHLQFATGTQGAGSYLYVFNPGV